MWQAAGSGGSALYSLPGHSDLLQQILSVQGAQGREQAPDARSKQKSSRRAGMAG